MSNPVWKEAPQPDKELCDKLSKEINVNRVVAGLLIQRGITNFDDARSFFRPSLNDLHDPFLFRDMERAVKRIGSAIERQEKILVYGDYDVDGTTSVAMMYDFLSGLTSGLEYYIPDRYKEGYGVSAAGIDYAIENGFSLVVCLDCGIRSVDLISRARENGVDFIICDHHLPGDTLPPAYALLDAKVPGETYPFKELSGCGVGFKLIQACCRYFELPDEASFRYLDLVAVSTCSDIVSITGENRIIVKYGLKKLNDDPTMGLRVLKNSCIKKPVVNTTDVVFYIGPRINAVGRLYDAKTAVKLLTVTNELEANHYTKILNETNSERKEIDESITAHALEMINRDPNHPERYTTVLYHPEWHKGVIGIVASRIIEHHYRPTIVLGYSDGKISGSARSVNGFDIHEALTRCSDLLLQFGGHYHAAGLSLLPENLELFMQRFDEVAASVLTRDMLIPVLTYDMEIKNSDITPSLVKLLQQFEPFGPGNMTPLFRSGSLRDTGYAKQMGSGSAHLSLNIPNPNFENPIKGVAFRQGNKLDRIRGGNPFEAIFSLEEESFNGNTRVQMNIRDIR